MQHGGNISRYRKEWGWSREEMIDFSANLNPLGPPDSVLRAIHGAIPCIADYPDPNGEEVRNALSKKWSLPENCFLLGNGAAEMIFLAMRLIGPKRVVTVAPAFREYEQAAKMEGAEIVRIPLSAGSDFQVDPAPVIECLPDADLLVLANPNNPTGRSVEPAVMEQILKAVNKNGVWLMVDEAFLDFLPDEDRRTLLHRVTQFDKLIVIRSLTKFFSIPGIRIGYAAADPRVIRNLKELQVPWSVNSLAQAAAVAGLDDTEFRTRTLKWLRQERTSLTQELQAKGYRVFPSDANFLLVRRDGVNIEELWPKLAEQGIFVRDCRSFAGLDETYFRIAVRKAEENARLLESLA
jgi:threonine-phosphate decarboxylase